MNEQGSDGHEQFEQRIREWYLSQEPSASLRTLAFDVRSARDESSLLRGAERRNLLIRIGVFGAVAAIIVLSFSLIRTASESRSHVRAIAAEIALNHEKHLDPDVVIEHYESAGGLLPKLGFHPAPPAHPATAGLRLAGGRYCSIRGAMAVQFRLYDDAGAPYTMYQFPHGGAGLRGESHIEIDGVDVRLWSRDGIMFGLASDRVR